MDFIETDEQQMLREAVGAIASKFGHEYYVEKAHADERTDELWNAVAEAGFLGVNVPEEYGGGGGGITELAIVHEELAAAGCPLLVIVVSPAICATIIAKFGTEAQKQRWLPRLRHRRAQDGLRHHRARRRVQLPQPVAHRHQGRRHLPAQRVEVLHLRRRRVRGRPGGDPHRASTRTPAGAGCRCSSWTPTRPGLDKQVLPVEITAPEKQYTLFFDNVEVEADRLHRRRGRGAAPGVRRAQPRAHPVGGHGQRHRPLRPGQGGRLRHGTARCGARPSAATRASPIRWPRPRSRSSWPG